PEIGNLTRLTELDLSQNRLTSLPPEIGNLTSLTELNLGGNHLPSLPPEIGNLTSLTKLNLGSNHLTSLPPEIGRLTHLTALYLWNNQLTSLPPEIGNLSSLTELNLWGNQLTSLPPEIGELANLQTLLLWDNQLTSLPPEIGNLTRLTELNLWGNQLPSLPPEVWRLPRLVKLDISGNPLPELPPELWQKTDWEALGLSRLNLTSLPPEIGNLTRLTELDLQENHLTSLPPEVWRLPRLVKLYIGGNPLPKLPPELWQKTDWEALELSRLNLTSLPPEIGNLSSLTKLELFGNRLTSLPPEIGNLTRLTELNLRYNQLPSLPPEIGNLTRLTELNLGGNQLFSLPPEIGNLTRLTRLDLARNQLTSLPPEIGNLTSLTTLDLERNHLTSLPPELARLERLKRLKLHGNPLTLTLPRRLLGDEIFGGDAQEILRFYRAIWEGGRALGEVRVLVVGQPAVGKTQLVRRLRELPFQENSPTTLTVETHPLPLGDLTAQVWDFGGQDFMHATHPVFFSARCVYVLVLNVRQTYEQNRVEYWLRTIRAVGGESPVIVVGNQAEAQGHVLDLPQNRLGREFPQIRAFVQTSAKDGKGLEALRAALAEAAASLPHTRVLFAQSHLAVKSALEAEKTRRDVIPYERVRELCAQEDITEKEDQDALLALLHDLGVVLDFRDEAGEPLSPDGVLNPNWVTDAVYRILTDPELRSETRGRLTPEMPRRILKDYQPWHRDLILKLLQRFELAYPAPEGVFYLPNVMPQDEPASAADPAWAGGLTFEYAYTDLPESIITRFIVRAHEHIEAGQVWRWGVILAAEGNRALVRADVADKRIEIHVLGPQNTRRDLLAFIRGHFEAIHKTFTESAGRENFPIQEFLCPPEYPGLRLDYRDLLIREREGELEVRPTWQGRVLRLNVSEVLNGFVSPAARQEERRRLFPEEERMAREIHYHEHRHFEVRGDMIGSSANLGNESTMAQWVENSFNTPSNPELAPLLAQLTAAVQEMLKHLPADQAEETAEDLKRLQEELAKPKPSRKWYSVSIEGLIKAAKNLGELGAPVIELAGKLLTLLGD
ncbi:MAG: leucine-rich repeat domain-containing protein, partial [Anaerolineales bacterium]